MPDEPTPDASADDAPAVEPDAHPAEEEGAELAKLKDESARRRVEAREATERADRLAARLTELTIATAVEGVMADPTDLARYLDGPVPTDDDGLPDAEAIKAAAEVIVADRPHLAPRTFRPIDQGATDAGGGFDLAGALRAAAG